MKKILVLFCAFINIAFMQEECSDFLTQDECLSYDFCEWVSDNPNGMNGMCVEFNNDDWYDNECSDLTQDECLETPECDWGTVSNPNGVFEMCVENNWNDYNDWECSDLGYEDCQYLDYCEWISDSDNPAINGYCVDAEGGNDDDGPPDCVLDCEGINNVSPEENATYFCEWLLSVFPSGCAEDCEQDVLDDIEEFMIVCDECLSDNNCDGIFDDNNDCDPDLECATVITCYEGLLYPTSCGPENCDEPIGECDDYYEGCQSDNGQWYDIGQEIFINDCEYYECTENGWEGPFSLDNSECSDNNGECSGLTQDECEWSDYCEWISDSDNPNSWGSCIEIDNDGPNQENCEELNYPDCIATEGCEWIITNQWGGYSCVESSDGGGCSDLGYEDCILIPNCQPNYNAAGEFEGCEEFNNESSFGFLYGTVSYIYGDVVDFVPYATLYIESVPSNSDMFYFETMTNGDGYYEIELPPGFYMVTAYANEEFLTHDVQIAPNSENELNFLIGDGYGPWNPFAQLSLGEYHTAIPGGEVVLPLYLSSNEFVGGVQFTIVANEPGLNLITFESTDPCFLADFNMIDDMQSIGIIFSLEGCSYPPEGMLEIAHMTFSVSPYIPIGVELEVFFSNTIVSDSIGNEIPSYGEGTVIMLGAKGDVNADGEFNVLDVVMMVNFALYVEDPNDLEFWASDMNDDGMINVLDVVQLVNIILEN